jgi:hypothetical protein
VKHLVKQLKVIDEQQQYEINKKLVLILARSCKHHAQLSGLTKYGYTRIATYLRARLGPVVCQKVAHLENRIDKTLRLGTTGRQRPDEDLLKLMAEAGFLWNSRDKRYYLPEEITAIINGESLPAITVEVIQLHLRAMRLPNPQKLLLAYRILSDVTSRELEQTISQTVEKEDEIAEELDFLESESEDSDTLAEINPSNHHKIASSLTGEDSPTFIAKEGMMAGTGLSQGGTERLVRLYCKSTEKLGYQYNPVEAALGLGCPETGSLGFTRDTLISVHQGEIGAGWGPVLSAGDWYAIAQSCYIPECWEDNEPILSESRFLGDDRALKRAVETSNHLC